MTMNNDISEKLWVKKLEKQRLFVESFHIGVYFLKLFVISDGKRQLAARYTQTAAVKWDNGSSPVPDK